MKKLFYTSFLCFSFLILHAQQNLTSDYDWSAMKIGNGGWAVGMNIHPSGDPIYFRSDVSGAYRWNEAQNTWISVVNANTMPLEEITHKSSIWDSNIYEGVVSIVSAPTNPNLAYMAFISMTPAPGESFGCIYKSFNQGNSWTKTNLCNVFMGANTESRLGGERLAVDPLDENVVYFGSQENGLWYTFDGGDNWSQVPTSTIPSGTDGYGIMNVVFDSSAGILNGKTKNIYVTVNKEGIYFSNNAGNTWSRIDNIAGGPNVSIGNLEDAVVNSSGVFYIAAREDLYKYDNGVWTDLAPYYHPWGEVAIDPFNENRVFLFPQYGNIQRSNDGGNTWDFLDHTIVATDVPWLATTHKNGSVVPGEVLFDPVIPGRLWFSQGAGTFRSDDLDDNEITFNSVNRGTETLVSNDIIAPPGHPVMVGAWDFGVFSLPNPDTYSANRLNPENRFNSAWDLDYCASNPSFIVGIIDDHRFCCPDGARQSGYSTDGGLSWNVFSSITNNVHPTALEFGNIAVAAADQNNIVWLPANDQMPFYTTDGGETWTQSTLPGATNGGLHALFLEKKILTADKVIDNKFYLYHWEVGLYISVDGGETWSLSPALLPAYGWHGKLHSITGYAGHLIFSLGLANVNAKIYHSTDGGQSFTELVNSPIASAIATGKAYNNYPTFYAAGELNGEEGIWRSVDTGVTWDKIGVYPMGIYAPIIAMEADQEIFGQVYLGISGSGFAYGKDLITTALPVEMADFWGTKQSNGIHLNWTTISEVNNDYFSIEYSSDGRTFEEIGVVQAVGNSVDKKAYQFLHDQPSFGANYYRLRQVDFNGAEDYSDTISVYYDKNSALTIYPNPIKENLFIEMEQASEVSLINGTGQLIWTKSFSAGRPHQINVSDLSAGVYYVKWADQAKKILIW